MKADEFDAVMRQTIEEPAAHRLGSLLRRGLIRQSDVQRFQVSCVEFRKAILGNYEALDPVVRDELRASLLREYQRTVGDLVEDIIRRDPAVCDDEADMSGEPPEPRAEKTAAQPRIHRQVIEVIRAKVVGWWQQRKR